MLILALETSTRAGSAALARDGETLAVVEGDPGRPHGERLPGDLLRLLTAQGVDLASLDLLAVSSGPGSFTSVRVGVATIQALALVHGCPVAPVSTLDAVARGVSEATAGTELLAAWMDGQRGEVFAALYTRAADGERLVVPPVAGTPSAVLDGWADHLSGRRVAFGGDGVASSRGEIESRLGSRATVSERLPPARSDPRPPRRRTRRTRRDRSPTRGPARVRPPPRRRDRPIPRAGASGLGVGGQCPQ